MEAFRFSREEMRTVIIAAAMAFFGVFINLCSGYSEWAAAGSLAEPAAAECFNYPLDINSCGPEELVSLPGIGPATARRIIKHRETSGGFKTRCDIKKVGGIGERSYENIKDKIFVPNDPSPGIDEPEEATPDGESAGPAFRIDINAATEDDFRAIKGLGRKVGQKIIEFRNNNGGRIDSFKQLSGIEGIGKKRLSKLGRYFVIY